MIIKIIILILIFIHPVFFEKSHATPLYAINSSNLCGGCHNPGRSEVEVWKRRCTLDCQGCHVDPNGAGARNQWGYYFEHDSLAILNAIKPPDPLSDDSRFDVHYDGRFIERRSSREKRDFPMNSEFTLRVRPFKKWLNVIYQANFLGRIGHAKLSSKKTHVLEKMSMIVDHLPFNLYTKLFRGEPVYALRHSNHSRWIREKIGLSPFRTVDGLSFGGTPTVPFLHFSLMEGYHKDLEEDKQKGFSFHGGMRGVTLGWNLHSSLWRTESQKAKIEMNHIGGGLKIKDVIIAAERNWRTVKEKQLTALEKGRFTNKALRLHPDSEIGDYTLAYEPIQGVLISYVIETLSSSNVNSMRRSLILDLHPIPYIQFEVWKRVESGHRQLADTVFVSHLYWDF